ncbi:MAG: DUF2333 family protein [Deltaproteobacteria bacterium]|nr:DUF2333 family protein [Deltaproteobacteria bacterium]
MEQFKSFAVKRMGAGIVAAGIALWAVWYVINLFDSPRPDHPERLDPFVKSRPVASDEHSPAADAQNWDDHWPPDEVPLPEGVSREMELSAADLLELDASPEEDSRTDDSHAPKIQESDHSVSDDPGAQHTAHDPAVQTPEHNMPSSVAEPTEHDAHGKTPSAHGVHGAPPAVDLPRGVAFVDATIKPIEYEITERFYGWRPNDIIEFTDNVNNFQLGVLEVTRRTTVNLTERISRTGTTAAFNNNLQNAMNWLMVKADSYWFPSAERKYKAALGELRKYKEKLFKGQASFYNRTDNVIPLLLSYESLLGSCEENLVKTKEKDGEAISFYISDDYFYYAKGVAGAMGTILEAVLVDFGDTIDSRRGLEVLHHAIESCHHATEIEPWIIFNSDPSSVWANHRANMAAPISHARFYISVLIKALST